MTDPVTCSHVNFVIAWFISSTILYGHVFLTIATFIFGFSILIRLLLGQLLNIALALLVYVIIGKYYHYECEIIGMAQPSTLVTQSYSTPVPFPSIELQVLAFTIIFVLFGISRPSLFTPSTLIRCLIAGSLWCLVTVSSFFWFHNIIQIILSIGMGLLMGWLWHRLWRCSHSMPDFTSSLNDSETSESPRKRVQEQIETSQIILENYEKDRTA